MAQTDGIKFGMTGSHSLIQTNMPYITNTSTLTCTFCGREFETRNVRMKRILCSDCVTYDKHLPPNLGQLTQEEKQRVYKRIRTGY